MQIRYTAPNEVDISGTVEDLQTVKQLLLDVATSDSTFYEVEAETDFDPSPYASSLRRMVVIKSQGPVKATIICDEYIQVEASGEKMEVFSSFFDFEPNTPSGHHCHHEYYEEDQYIAPDSVPLVISIK